MKTTRLGFYSTSGDVASHFDSIAQSYTQSWYSKDVSTGSPDDLAKHISEKTDPDNLIFFGTHATGETLLTELDTLANACQAETQVYVFSPERDVFVYRQVLGMGVSGCETLPIDPDFVSKEIGKFLNIEGSGKLVLGATVLAGVGFSTAFLNIASRCAYRLGASRSVALVDGDSAAGITNLFVQQGPRSYVQFDTSAGTDFFQGSVESETAKFENFRIFPTPARVLDKHGMSDVFLDEGLTEVTDKSDYTFVDFGTTNNLLDCQAIEHCDHILLASRPSLNGVRIMREVLQSIIDNSGAIEKISCIFIGRGRGGKKEVNLKKIKEILPNINVFDIPDSPSYVFNNESTGSLKFLGKRPSNKYEKSIDQVVISLMG